MQDFNLFRTLVTLRECQNFELAAKKLNISQPTVSRQLQELGRHLGVPLLLESGRRKILSPFAENLCDRLAKLFTSWEQELEAWQRESQHIEEHTLRVGGRVTLVARILRQAPTYPRLIVNEMSSQDVIPALVAGKIDAGVIEKLPPRAEILSKKLFHESMVIVVHPSLLKKERDASSVVQSEIPALAFREDLAPLQTLLAHYKRKPPRYSRVVADWPVLIELAEKALGWVLAPEAFIKDQSPLKTFELPPGLLPKSTFNLVLRKELRQIQGFRQWFESI